MTNSISGDSNSPKRITNLKEFQAANPEVKNSKHINSIFNELDVNKDGVLQKEEGELFLLSNGGIYAEKNGKAFSGITENGNRYEYGEDGKPHFVEPKKEFILSTKHRNTKVAQYDKDGNLRTSFTVGDSFEGTMIRLGLDPSDAEVRKLMEEANPEAAKRKYFTLEDDGDKGTQVKIPKEILNKYDVRALATSIRLYKKSEAKQADTVNEQYAKNMENAWKDYEIKTVTPDPVIQKKETPVQPVEEKTVKKEVKTADDKSAKKAEKANAKKLRKAEKAKAKELRIAEKAKGKEQRAAEKVREAELKAAEKAKAKEQRAAEKAKEAEMKTAQKAEKARKAEEAKKAAEAKKAEKHEKAKPVNNNFGEKIKTMKTGISQVPDYKINMVNGKPVVTHGKMSVALYRSSFMDVHPYAKDHDSEGYFHRGPVKAKVPDVLNQQYTAYSAEMAIKAAIYQDLAKKENPTPEEKLAMQSIEKEISDFFNTK